MKAALLASVAGFLALMGLAAACYPGGTVLDPRTPGHDFWRNYLCDLLQPVALNGAPNPVGAVAAPIGMLLLGVGIVAFFWLLPVRFPAQGVWAAGCAGSGSPRSPG